MSEIINFLFNVFFIIFAGTCLLAIVSDEVITVIKDIKQKWGEK